MNSNTAKLQNSTYIAGLFERRKLITSDVFYKMDFRKIFDFAVANGASDIHIQALLPPMMRIAGRMRSVDSASLSNEQTIDLIASMAPRPICVSLSLAGFLRFLISIRIKPILLMYKRHVISSIHQSTFITLQFKK